MMMGTTLLLLINLMSMLMIINLVHVEIKKRKIVNHTLELSSFKPKFEILKPIEERYLKQTQLERVLTLDEFGQIYIVGLVISIVISLSLQLNTVAIILVVLAVLLTPVLILEKYLIWIDLKIDQGIFELLTQINAQLIKNEDLISAIKEAQSNIKNKYIVYIIKQFNQLIKIGIPPNQVFSIIQSSIHNDYMKYLFVNIEIVFNRRGNITELMKALENEFTSIQIEVNKRKVEIEYEKNMLMLSVALVVLTVVKIIKDHDYILVYFHQNTQMIYFVLFFIIIGLIIAISANNTSY